MSRNASTSRSNNASKQPRYAVPALEKGLAIIEFLATNGRGHTQTEIAKQLGRSQSEIFRMLTCLEQHDYIHRGLRDERYRLTSKLFELAHAHPPTAKLIDIAMPVMRRFAEQTDQSCHLVVHQDHKVVVIAQVDSPGFVGVSVKTGRVLPLHESVSGRVLAAFEPPEMRNLWLEGMKKTLSSKHLSELNLLMENIQSQGYDSCPSTIIEGILDLSVPVLNHRGESTAALSVPCLLPSQSKKTAMNRVLKELHLAVNEISLAIGCGPEANAE